MNDAFEASKETESRVPVWVMFLEGAALEARARLEVDGGADLRWVPAVDIARGLGVAVDETLAGRRAIAVVRGGELVGFEPVPAG